MEYNNSSYGI